MSFRFVPWTSSGLAALLCACSALPPSIKPAAKPEPVLADDHVLARSDRLLIYIAQPQDTYWSIAERFLGSSTRDWEIVEANRGLKLRPGNPVIVPLKTSNPYGVKIDQYQTVPILCYHRIGMTANKMTVSASNFAQQLDWLDANGFRVIRLQDLAAFMAGKQALPRQSVVITFDDGYESYYRYAYPLLKKHAFPATVFLYTDFVGASDALSWPQMREMVASGLIDIQPHSKTHAKLTERFRDETDAAYQARIGAEAKLPREQIERQLKLDVNYYAYPYGAANDTVLEALQQNKYQLGVTVTPGGNAFHAQPYMLHRSMVFGSHTIEEFKAKLQTSRPLSLP